MASNPHAETRTERHLRVEAGPPQWQEFDERSSKPTSGSPE
jgi:hypothetical protein